MVWWTHDFNILTLHFSVFHLKFPLTEQKSLEVWLRVKLKTMNTSHLLIYRKWLHNEIVRMVKILLGKRKHVRPFSLKYTPQVTSFLIPESYYKHSLGAGMLDVQGVRIFCIFLKKHNSRYILCGQGLQKFSKCKLSLLILFLYASSPESKPMVIAVDYDSWNKKRMFCSSRTAHFHFSFAAFHISVPPFPTKCSVFIQKC